MTRKEAETILLGEDSIVNDSARELKEKVKSVGCDEVATGLNMEKEVTGDGGDVDGSSTGGDQVLNADSDDFVSLFLTEFVGAVVGTSSIYLYLIVNVYNNI